MSATVFVAVALAVAIPSLVLLIARRWRIVAMVAFVPSVIAAGAEAPHAAAELWGWRLPGVIAATQESLRLESIRLTGQRMAHYSPKHRFGAIVCYRAAGKPGIGASTPIDPAILAAIGDAPSEADRTCRTVAGAGILRQTELSLDEATHDATRQGQAVVVQVLQPLGLFEWAWATDAPLLPWLPRPGFATGAPVAVAAEVVAIIIDTRGSGLLSRNAHDYAVPIAHVRLRYAPPGHPGGVEGFDAVDAASVAHLTPGSRVGITIAANAPRVPRLTGATRSYWWRNHVLEVGFLLAVAAAVIGLAFVLRRRRRRRA